MTLIFNQEKTSEIQITPNINLAYLDLDKLKFPLTLCLWKKGDRMVPIGMRGNKKISDILIDLKIPRHQKKEIWVLRSADEICWIVGLRLSENFKVTQNTQTVYQIKKIT